MKVSQELFEGRDHREQGRRYDLCVLIPATLSRKADLFAQCLVSCHHVDQMLG